MLENRIALPSEIAYADLLSWERLPQVGLEESVATFEDDVGSADANDGVAVLPDERSPFLRWDSS